MTKHKYETYDDAINVVRRILELYDNLLNNETIDDNDYIFLTRIQSIVYMTLNDLESKKR